MLLPQTLLILPRVATRGGAAIAHVLDSKTSQPIRSAYPVGLTWVTLHASGSAPSIVSRGLWTPEGPRFSTCV